MHFARARKTLTAWFGLVAMALVLFAPVVSQALASHTHRVELALSLPLCEAKPAVASATSAMLAVNVDGHADGHDAPADHHAACGYCDLLAQHVLAPTADAPVTLPAPVHARARMAPPERVAFREARHAGRPRDSPFFI
ncbi:DUF2946 domain-containing protein [Ralstonia mannitolilytica]|uniref:DUF2946 domain-containing protein n=2 Tax=Ralstonia TaxID=48736 RepID=A0ABC8QJ84_9RALS|nr:MULTISPECIES: DUF2946 domain-containing protein [Ralstonia]MBB0027241.1 DUF2946 domain-containing protein [Ralstonia pickettii]MBB0037743.1 DUF2946 domain-containing protein [Ralstonia pickettii]MBB0100265.1 DUF2946 domain-containing protein [Ralstonia pickettii]MBB0110267.1 DUF2946 domain-containing protein [Ralstonia pickettii]MBB0131342.1 DUF2946 domain-containing protein [Ralstonia pickettii]